MCQSPSQESRPARAPRPTRPAACDLSGPKPPVAQLHGDGPSSFQQYCFVLTAAALRLSLNRRHMQVSRLTELLKRAPPSPSPIHPSPPTILASSPVSSVSEPPIAHPRHTGTYPYLALTVSHPRPQTQTKTRTLPACCPRPSLCRHRACAPSTRRVCRACRQNGGLRHHYHVLLGRSNVTPERNRARPDACAYDAHGPFRPAL